MPWWLPIPVPEGEVVPPVRRRGAPVSVILPFIKWFRRRPSEEG